MQVWFARNFPAYRPNTVLLDNALATMGAGAAAGMCCFIIAEGTGNAEDLTSVA